MPPVATNPIRMGIAMTDTALVTMDINDGIAHVRLNRPAKHNAINDALLLELEALFNPLDDAIRVVVLTGSGDNFCAGLDLAEHQAREPFEVVRHSQMWHRVFGKMTNAGIPIVAVLKGAVIGGGLELALSADVILAADHASFALPEITSGTVADAASIKLPKRIPYHIAMEMLFTGRWLDAEEAHRWGFVNHIHAADDLMTQAWNMARLLASGPPLVYAAIKEIVRDAEDSNFQDAMNRITKRQLKTVDVLYGSEDNAEGARAFAEKRDPVWKGR